MLNVSHQTVTEKNKYGIVDKVFQALLQNKRVTL